MPSRHEPSRPAVPQQNPSPTLKSSLPSHTPAAVKSGTQGGGQALDRHINAEMSAKFGHDFSQVRIHTDACAGKSAQAMGANAYALGSDIVFGAGKYNPGSPETDRLLAHELTHIVQQAQLGPGDWGRASDNGDTSEREADGLASQVITGRGVSVQAAPGAAIARDADASQDAWVQSAFGVGGSPDGEAMPGGPQESWVTRTLGVDPSAYINGSAPNPGASSGSSAEHRAWVNQTLGVGESEDGGGGVPASESGHDAWVNQTLNVDPSAYGGETTPAGGAEHSAWVDRTLGVDPSAG